MTAKEAIVPPSGKATNQRSELWQLITLSLSLGFVQLGHNLTGFVDTAIAGRAGGVVLAATGLGSAVFFAVSVFGIGVLLGLEPIIAQAFGAERRRHARAALWQGFYVAALITVPISAGVLALGALLPSFGLEAELADQTFTYLVWRLPSLWPLFASVAVRLYLQAMHKTRAVVLAVIAVNVFNGLADWIFIFGDRGLMDLGLPAVGLPPLGVAGVGAASTVSTVAHILILAFAVRGVAPGPGEEPVRAYDRTVVRQTFVVGMPLGLQLAAEVGIFALVGLLMGKMGTTVMASHQVALQWAGLSFAMSLGIGSATAVQVGRAIGRGDVPGTRRAGFSGIGGGAIFMACCALLFWIYPDELSRLMTSDADVIPGAAALLIIAAVFQVADGVQAVGSGALRGAGETRFTFLAHLVGHWCIGFPVAIGLAYGADMGPAGLWWGLTAGLAAVAIALTVRFAIISSRPIAALDDAVG